MRSSGPSRRLGVGPSPWHSDRPQNPVVLQTLLIVLIGLLATLFVLTTLVDLVPDDLEWIATVAIVVLSFSIVVAIRLRSRE